MQAAAGERKAKTGKGASRSSHSPMGYWHRRPGGVSLPGTIPIPPMPSIFNYGSINIDDVYRVPHFVRPGETLASLGFTRGAGGKGFNQSVALARAGATVRHVGRYGPEAAWLRDRLAAEGIDVRGLLPSDLPAGRALIQVDDRGENAIVLCAGANHALTPDDLPPLLAEAGPGDWFVTQNETSAVSEALSLAHTRGLTVCFNPAPMTGAVRDYALDAVDWLIVNETEGEALSGETAPPEVLRALRRRCPRAHLVLTLGAEGVRCLAPDGEEAVVPALRVTPVDTTAAGDSFIGYLLAARLRGTALEEALRQACRAAALSVTRPGAAESIPRLAEIS